MKPTPLLDFWQKPAGAGEPVALVATTFALEPDFFERDCLARFLEVSSVSEDTGSVEDIVASVELHELLQKVVVTILADRSAPAERTSLLWDLLSCYVQGGLLHAKVAVLLWEDATRVILGSANLTRAGYRRQIELGLTADLGPACMFPPAVLHAIARELESYVELVPGYDENLPVFRRVATTLGLFRERVTAQASGRSAVKVSFAPTNGQSSPLDQVDGAWKGPQPLWATHLSPFWDANDGTALATVRKRLTGRPAQRRSQDVAVALGPSGRTSFPQALAGCVNSVREMKPLDQELRLLHAKCLLLESETWVAALVGSSNHTRSGLGLAARRHREINVWIGASPSSKEGKALLDLIQLGKKVPPDAEEIDPTDEDEADIAALPPCFGLCRVTRDGADQPWELQLGIANQQMPEDWTISLTSDRPLLTRTEWHTQGEPASTTIGVQAIPMYLIVEWNGNRAPWAVVADDRHALPPGPALASLRAQQLLDALASGRTVADILREELLRTDNSSLESAGINLDPLKRLEVPGSLLRRGRALAASLSAMQRRLELPIFTLDTLRARLAGPLGPEFVATKVAEAYDAGERSRADAIFTIAEIALSVGRVSWPDVLQRVDSEAGLALIGETLVRLNTLRAHVGEKPRNLASYAGRAIKETRRCLAS